jgi:hypothetical protein
MNHTTTQPSSWMLTSTGHVFDLRTPHHRDVMLADVAHSLAQINRYTGHARRPYSVAEHSLLVLDILERQGINDVHAQFAGLMHDAHEIYTGDVPPMHKQLLGDAWAQLEARCEATMRTAFALHAAFANHGWQVKCADMIALATEREQLMPPGGPCWPTLLHVQPVGWVDLMSSERLAMQWHDWRDRFKDAADALDFARNEVLFPVAQP